nr:MAG TPA: hypothetical protein [Caudoviricetes sp.]
MQPPRPIQSTDDWMQSSFAERNDKLFVFRYVNAKL